ncbi:hypothetical protein QVD17_12653 [Tagetes erecta]|uniref:Uncharacterized protein n=1 Tax=Tagetes erecta TaxID=13708 RepID=A0AAD8L2F9_TARER|nr:hypothetical protein QVD17_12653 [Tagetes erecta]
MLLNNLLNWLFGMEFQMLISMDDYVGQFDYCIDFCFCFNCRRSKGVLLLSFFKGLCFAVTFYMVCM